MDAIVCDVNQYHMAKEKYGRQFGVRVLRSMGNGIRKLARKTGGIGCRQDGDTFLLYCQHQDNYEELLKEFVSGIYSDEGIDGRISLRVGIYSDARQEPNVVERFACAEIAADRVKDDPEKMFGFYDLN